MAASEEVESGVIEESEPQVWNAFLAAYIPLSEHRKRESLESRKSKKRKKRAPFSTKFATLSPSEVRMYEAVDETAKEHLRESVMDRVPHEILLIVMIYSQGFKFEQGDYVVCFKGGFLHIHGSELGYIVETVELTEAQRRSMYSIKQRKQGTASDFAYKIKFNGVSKIIPMSKVFSTRIVIDDEIQHIVHMQGRMVRKEKTTKSGGTRSISQAEMALYLSPTVQKAKRDGYFDDAPDRDQFTRVEFDSSRMFFAKPMKKGKRFYRGRFFD